MALLTEVEYSRARFAVDNLNTVTHNALQARPDSTTKKIYNGEVAKEPIVFWPRRKFTKLGLPAVEKPNIMFITQVSFNSFKGMQRLWRRAGAKMKKSWCIFKS